MSVVVPNHIPWVSMVARTTLQRKVCTLNFQENSIRSPRETHATLTELHVLLLLESLPSSTCLCALTHNSSISARFDFPLTNRFNLRAADSKNRCTCSISCVDKVARRCSLATLVARVALEISDIVTSLLSNSFCLTWGGMASSDRARRGDRTVSYVLMSMESKASKSQPRPTAGPAETEGLSSGIM